MRKYVLHVENTTYRFFFFREKYFLKKILYLIFYDGRRNVLSKKKKKEEVNLEVFYKRKYFYEGSIFKIKK